MSNKKKNKILSLFLASALLLLLLPDASSIQRTQASGLGPDITPIPTGNPEAAQPAEEVAVEEVGAAYAPDSEISEIEEITLELGDGGDEEPQPSETEEAPERFEQGYVRVARDELFYADAALNEVAGVFDAEGYLWAQIERRGNFPEEDVLRVAFNTARRRETGADPVVAYIRFDAVEALDDAAQTALRESLEDIREWNGIPLPETDCILLADVEEDLAERSAEESMEASTEESTDGSDEDGEPTGVSDEDGEPTEVSDEEQAGEPAEEPGEDVAEGPTEEPDGGAGAFDDPFIRLRGRTLKDRVNVRTEATTQSEALSKVEAAGTELDVLAAQEADGETWYRVRYGEIEGYIRGDLIEVWEEVEDEPEETPAPGVAGEHSYPGADYTVNVSYGPEAELPEGVALEVREILPDTEEYAEYLAQATEGVDAAEGERLAFLRFFDISFVLDGAEIEPKGPVSVQILFPEPETGAEDVNVLHITESGVDVLDEVDATRSGDALEAVAFDVDAFSTFAVMGVVRAPAAGATVVESDTCGGCTWTFYSDDTLIIKPTNAPKGTLAAVRGATHPNEKQYWNKYKERIKKVEFEDGVVAHKNSYTMFDGCTVLEEVDFGNFDTSNATSMYAMFKDCQKLKRVDMSKFNTSRVTSFQTMFCRCYALDDLTLPANFVTSAAKTMLYMFQDCRALTSLNTRDWDTSNVTNMSYTFDGCYALESLDVSNFNTANVTNMSYMFRNCYALTTIGADGSKALNWNMPEVTALQYMFNNCHALQSLEKLTISTGATNTNMSYMFYNCNSLRSLENLKLTKTGEGSATSTDHMFEGCANLEALDIRGLRTAKATNMTYMFNGCSKLTDLDLSNFDTSRVTNMAYMFNHCSKLERLDVSSFQTTNAANMAYMFNDCSALTALDLGNFDMRATSNVTYFLHNNEALRQITVGPNFSFKGAMTSFTFPDYGSIDVWKNQNTGVKYTAQGLASVYNSGYAATYVFDESDRAKVEITITVQKKGKNGEDVSRTGEVRLDLDDENGQDVILYWDAANGRYTTVGEEGKGTTKMTLAADAESVKVLLPIGSYTLHQENVDSGYQKAGDYPFELGAYTYQVGGADATGYGLLNENKADDGTYPTEITLLNTQLVGRVTVRKVDLSEVIQGNLKLIFLEGAEFRLWREDESGNVIPESVRTGATDAQGTLVFDGLSLEVYKLQETKAPAGYVRNNTVYTCDFTAANEDAANGATITNGQTGQTTRQVAVRGNVVSATLALSARRIPAAGTAVHSGTCGGCQWQIDADGLLTIWPTDGVSGQLEAVTGETHWNAFGEEIKNAKFEDGVSAAWNSGSLFEGCANLETVDFGNFDTGTAGLMNAMFQGCKKLTALDLRGFDTGNVSDFDNMFADCNALHTLQLPGTFVTSAATNMSYMFQNCGALTELDVSGFDTQNVTNLSYVFDGCASLKALNVSGWDTHSATTTAFMFRNCSALTELELRGWNMGKVTTIQQMFDGCASIRELDLTGWDLTSTTVAAGVFNRMSNLETLKLNDVHTAKFNSKIVPGTTMYSDELLLKNCYNLRRVEAVNSEFCFGHSAAVGTAFPDGTWKYRPMRSDALAGYDPAQGADAYVEADGTDYGVAQLYTELVNKTYGGSRLYFLAPGVYERVTTQSAGFEDKPLTDYIIDNLETPSVTIIDPHIETNDGGDTFYYKMVHAGRSTDEPFTANGPLLKLRFPRAAIDVNGDRYDMILTVSNLVLPNLETYENKNNNFKNKDYYVGPVMEYDVGMNTFNIMDYRRLTIGGSANGTVTGPMNVDVSIKIVRQGADDDLEGTFLFYSSDLDVNDGSYFQENAEGVKFGDGFHLGTIVRGDETLTQWAYYYVDADGNKYKPSEVEGKVGSTHHYDSGNIVPDSAGGVTYTRVYYTDGKGNPNYLIGTRNDVGTYLSGFFIAGEASGASFTWTAGKECGTTFLGGGGVTVVKIEKKDQDGEGLAGAKLQLHNEHGELIREWDSDANESKNFILNSGLYRLSEVSAPGGRQLADDIWFRVNPDGSISVSVTGKDGRYLTQASDDGSATAALEMINRFFTIERVVENERVKGDIEITKWDAETGKTMAGVRFSLAGVPDISGKYQYVEGEKVEKDGDTDVTGYYFPEGSNVGFPRDAAGNFINFNTYKLKLEKTGATDSNGKLIFEGIEQGVYVLTETTPDNYQALEDRYWVQIDERGNATLYKQAGAGSTTVTIDEDNQLTLPGGATPVANKTITNMRERHNLTVGKTVSGNMGSKAKYFKVTIKLEESYAASSGEPISNTYAIDLTNADADANGNTNPTSITVSGGTGTVNLWLRHGQTVTVKDLPDGIKYTVSEERDGYTAKYSLNGGSEANGGSTGQRTLTADATVAFANELKASTPTGIVDSVAPALWGGLIVMLLLGLACAGGKKRRAH